MIRKIDDLLRRGDLPEEVQGKPDASTLREIVEELKVMQSRIDIPRSKAQKPKYTRLITDLWWADDDQTISNELLAIANLWRGRAP